MVIAAYARMTIRKIEDGRYYITRLHLKGKGRGSVWAKKITKVDPSKENGYAFEGEFLREGSVVEEGDWVITVAATGSWKYPANTIFLFRIEGNEEEDEFEIESVGEWEWNAKGEKIEAIQQIYKIIHPPNEEEVRREEVRKAILRLYEKYGEMAVEEMKKFLNEN